MSKCNRNVCAADGVFAHVDILTGSDGQPARYCLKCAHVINRANLPMTGFPLVPTNVSEMADVLLVKLAEDPTITGHSVLAELGRRLLAPIALNVKT